LKHKAPDRDLPGVRALLKKPRVEQIEKAVDSVLSSEPKLARQVKLNLCHRYSGMKLREIGLRYGLGQSAITQASRRIKLKAGKDKKLRKTVNRIEKMINM
jgi:chromosomal replication initiation ATPase DnaA